MRVPLFLESLELLVLRPEGQDVRPVLSGLPVGVVSPRHKVVQGQVLLEVGEESVLPDFESDCGHLSSRR